MRKCWRCENPIHLCMGFVGGEGLVQVLEGKPITKPIFETCGRCALLLIFAEHAQKPKPFLLPSEAPQ